MCDSFSDPEEFLRLATRNDDTSFNQWVPDHLCLRTPAFANNFRELHVVSNADWDEEHPAGSLLDDILLVRLYSYANFIHEGYPGKNDNTFLSKRKYLSVIKKLMSELTPADMEMIYCCEVNDFSTDTLYPVIVFTSAPTLEKEHTLTLRWTSLGYPALYPGFESEPESMEWVSQYADANMVKTDFFEARSTAYAKSTALIDDL